MRKFLAIVAVLCFGFAVTSADEFMLVVKKVDGNKITGTKFAGFKKGGDNAKPEDVTLTATNSVKVTKGKFNKESKKMEAGDAITGGLSNAMFKPNPNKFGGTISKIDGSKLTVIKTPFSIMCSVVTDADKVTEVRVMGGGGFGGGVGFKGKGKAKGEEVTLTVANSCKFVSRKYDPDAKEMKTTTLADGLKNEAFQKQNVRVQLTVDNNNNVTEISIGGFGGRGRGGFGPGGKKGNDKST